MKRGIAGTLIFIVFDRHALLNFMLAAQFVANNTDMHPDWSKGNSTMATSGIITNTAVIQNPTSVYDNYQLNAPWMVD